jgi:four helix bundle protein
MVIESYKDLDVWKLAIEQCMQIYKITKSFPKDELYGIISQMRRAATSIPANIAEGYSRRHEKEKIRFINIALGSNAELETHLIVAEKLNYLDNTDNTQLLEINNHIGRSLTNFYRSLESKL